MDDICEPRVVTRQFVYESPEEHSIESIYNCNLCDIPECPYFEEYNS